VKNNDLYLSIKNILPTKKFLFRAIPIIIILGIVIFFDLRKEAGVIKTTLTDAKQRKELKSKIVSDITFSDSDGDSIPDWEEYLWGTNPEKQDSDNDGVSDSEEVLEQKKSKGLNSNENMSEENSTDQFSKEFFATIVSLKQSGTLTTEALANLSNSLIENVSEEGVPDAYNIDDIKIGVTIPSIYYKNLGEVLYSSRTFEFGSELQELSILVDTANEASASRLSVIGSEYKSLSEKVMDIVAPSEVYATHLLLANSLYKTGDALQKAAVLSSDPISGITGISLYFKYSEEFTSALSSLEDYFTQKGIIVP
jgi:hypothetical protein